MRNATWGQIETSSEGSVQICDKQHAKRYSPCVSSQRTRGLHEKYEKGKDVFAIPPPV